MEKDKKESGGKFSPMPRLGAGVAIGAGIGVALGVAMDNITVGIAIGFGAGIVLGIALSRQDDIDKGEE